MNHGWFNKLISLETKVIPPSIVYLNWKGDGLSFCISVKKIVIELLPLIISLIVGATCVKIVTLITGVDGILVPATLIEEILK